ncbi:sensor histidine kinase [Corticicoccus populi]|uniref:histidine kinase n=1 Tax=Corticicoccus populi TaxID=1812821 RepID=A0ABW5WSV0_9STAP
MSITKKMVLSNIILLIVPVISLFFIDIVLGYLIIVSLNGSTGTFITLRFISIILVFLLVNVTISWLVSRHIIRPIQMLNEHARKIGEGDLDTPVTVNRNDEIGSLSDSFETMRKNLKTLREKEDAYNRNRQILMAGLSHDLKTPLTSMKGYVNGIADGVADTVEKRHRYTETINQSIERMESMINELFLYSKLDLEEVEFHFSPVQLAPYFSDIVSEYQLDHPEIMIELQGSQHLAVSADREQFYRAVSNIIGNSIKYRGQEPLLIQINIFSKDGFVYIDIKDNGAGIDEHDLPHVFETFYRTDQSRNSTTGGSGLGLAIVKRIIEKHDGEINISSLLNKETVVSIKLPQVML